MAATGGVNDVGLPLPTSVIASRLVEGLGVHCILQAGIVSADRHAVGMTAVLAADGSDLTEFSLWWVGPAFTFRIQAAQIFSDVSADIQMDVTWSPMDQYMVPNSNATEWASGQDAVRRSEFVIAGGTEPDINFFKTKPWVFRVAMVCSNNFTKASMVLQIIPVGLPVMDALTDPRSQVSIYLGKFNFFIIVKLLFIFF